MNEEKVSIPKFGGPQDNLLFCSTRIAAIFAEREACDPGEAELVDSCSDADDTAQNKKAVRAYSVILRGQGDVPFAVIPRQKSSPKKMWDALLERYAVKNRCNKASVQTSLARLEYDGQDINARQWVLAWTKGCRYLPSSNPSSTYDTVSTVA